MYCSPTTLLLSLADRGLTGPAVGVELNPDAALLLERAIEENEFSFASCHRGDLKTYRPGHRFNLVVANPPYYTHGQTAHSPARALARHQLACTLRDVCHTAAALLGYGGTFCLCWPSEFLAALFSELEQARFASKRMQLVRKGAGEKARLVLMEARKNGGAGLALLPDILLPSGETLHY